MKSLGILLILSALPCFAHNQTFLQNSGLQKTISSEIVFVPLSAIQPHTISKPLSKKTFFALCAIGSILGKLLLQDTASPLIELITRAIHLFFKEDSEPKQNDPSGENTETDLQGTLLTIARFVSEHAQDLITL